MLRSSCALLLALPLFLGFDGEANAEESWQYEFLDALPSPGDMHIPCRTHWVAVGPITGRVAMWAEEKIELIPGNLGDPIRSIDCPSAPTALLFGPEEKTLYIGRGQGKVTCFDLSKSKVRWSAALAPHEGGGEDYVHHLELSPDGNHLTVSTPSRVGIIAVATGAVVAEHDDASMLVFSGTGTHVAVAARNGTIHIFEWGQEKTLTDGKRASDSFPENIARAPLVRVAGIAGFVAVTEEAILHIDPKTRKGSPLVRFTKPERLAAATIRAVSFPGDGVGGLTVSGVLGRKGVVYRIRTSGEAGIDAKVECGSSVPATLTPSHGGDLVYATSGGELTALPFEKSFIDDPDISHADRKYARILRDGAIQFCVRNAKRCRLVRWNPFTNSLIEQRSEPGQFYTASIRYAVLRRKGDLVLIDREKLTTTRHSLSREREILDALREPEKSRLRVPTRLLYEEDSDTTPRVVQWNFSLGKVDRRWFGPIGLCDIAEDGTLYKVERFGPRSIRIEASDASEKKLWQKDYEVPIEEELNAPFEVTVLDEVTVSPNGSRLLVRMIDGRTLLIDTESHAELARYHGIFRSAFSSSGNEVILSIGVNAMGWHCRIHESLLGKPIARVQFPPGAQPTELEDVAPGGSAIIFRGKRVDGQQLTTGTFVGIRK